MLGTSLNSLKQTLKYTPGAYNDLVHAFQATDAYLKWSLFVEARETFLKNYGYFAYHLSCAYKILKTFILYLLPGPAKSIPLLLTIRLHSNKC